VVISTTQLCEILKAMDEMPLTNVGKGIRNCKGEKLRRLEKDVKI